MNILVTGGAGYIGSVTVESLVARGDTVVVYDNLIKGHRGAVHPAARFVEGDLLDSGRLTATLGEHQISAVVHFAAHSLVGESMQNPGKYFQNNVAGSLSLADALVAAGVRVLVFSSTAAVYGEPATLPIGEDAPTVPTNAYGASKLAFEQLLPWYDRAHGLKFVSLRYFNACGASEHYGEDHQPETHLIPLLLQVAQGGRAVAEIYGDDYATPDGTAVRDYIHVLDLAEAHVHALEHLAGGGASAIYNLGNGQGFSVQEVIAAARRVTGHPIPVRHSPRRAGDPAALVASAAAIRAALHWNPRYPDLDSIIASAWRWQQAHPRGYAAG
ncbi:MAG TPA: UDP-glucose 4-epimerase GalE [Chloroflexia bacterium]|nr:UDP-glucose 4-epimerase GalE [Chloroflexia bacterium]